MDLNIQKRQNSKIQRAGIFQKLLNALTIKEANELITTNETDDIQNLIDSIINAREEWMKANLDFDYAVDEDMIDYYTYKIKAYQTRYEHLIKVAKEKGIKVESLIN